MQADLKRLHSPDIKDLVNYKPEDPSQFSLLLQAMIGPKGEEGEESFDIEVCTPRWLGDTYGIDEVVIGRHHLIVQEYSYDRIVQTIETFLLGCSGSSWRDVALKVARLGYWEFEDYIE